MSRASSPPASSRPATPPDETHFCRSRGRLVWLLIPATMVAAVGVLVIVGGQRVMHPSRPAAPPVPPAGRRVVFPASDGVTIRGWYAPVEAAKGTVIYGPGRGEGLNDFDFRYIPLFNRNGYSILLFDARGMGASDGAASLGALEWQDYLGAVEYPKGLGVQGVAFCGTSQGGAAAILAAARTPAALAVVAESPYASWQEMRYSAAHVQSRVPEPAALPLSRLIAWWVQLRLSFREGDAEPASAIGRISPRAVLLIAGPHAPYIPMAETERLFAAAGEPKELWAIPEAGHTQGLERRPAEYEARVIAFLDRRLAGAEGAHAAR